MTIPSSVDPTLAPPGCHVVQLFIQYVPYTLAGGQGWTEELKEEFAGKGLTCFVVVCQIRDIYCFTLKYLKKIPNKFKITVQLLLQYLFVIKYTFNYIFNFVIGPALISVVLFAKPCVVLSVLSPITPEHVDV